jgi:4-coumarate--CoA ligase (photoactive yellow protein activation family)
LTRSFLKERGYPSAATDLSEDVTLDEAGLGLDSIDRLALVGRVNQMFHLYETGIEDNLLRFRQLGQWTDLVVDARAQYNTCLSFFTSGSTDAPKACPHPLASLWQEATALCQLLPVAPRRVLALVPCHHLYGFVWTVLLPKVLAVPVQAVPAGQVPPLLPGDLLVSVPTLWQFWLEARLLFPAGCVAVTSGGPCPEDVLAGLHAAQVAYVLDVHGASETGAIGLRRLDETPTETAEAIIQWPYTLLPHWKRLDSCHIQRQGLEDALPQALPDVVQWHDDQRYSLLRRQDAAVQVGGVNVFPQRVAQCFRLHPSVADCAVRLSAETGCLKALVVLQNGLVPNSTVETALQQWAHQHLAPQERPRSVVFAHALPVNEMGKLRDW